MTKETTETKPAPVKRVVDQIDFTKPFAVLVHQTDARNNIEIIEGHDCVEIAKEKAAELAISKGRHIAVFGPQIAVKAPPAKPTADDVPLSF